MGVIGYNTIAGTDAYKDSSSSAAWDIAGEYTPAQDEVLVDGFVYAIAEAGRNETVEVGCYRASDGVLMEKTTISIPQGSGTGWYSASFAGTATLASGVAYRNAFTGGQNAGVNLFRDVVSSAEGYDLSITGATGLTSPFVEDGVGNYRYSTYLTTTAAAPSVAITDVDGDESVYPGESFVITGTGFGATQGTGGVDIDGVTQTPTNWTDTSITCTAVRGGNSYDTGKTLTVTTDAATTATITVAQEAEPNTFAVTAASPNTTDDASLWTGLVDTATSNPITIVNGDQAWVKNPNNLTNLAVAADGTITADEEGDFVVQIWLASEGVWGSDQTVTFEVPVSDSWPFGKGIKHAANQNWTWGKRHPMTSARVRIFK